MPPSRSSATPLAAAQQPRGHRSGFVALVGRPNVGKSTFLNLVLGTKVAITSPVPQTTRTVVRGVLTRREAQVIFLDTPGIHLPRHRLGAFMVEQAQRALREVDLIAWMVEAEGLRDEDGAVAAVLRPVAVPVVLVVNKVDRVDRARAAQTAREAWDLVRVAETFMISAATGAGVEEMVNRLVARLPEGPPLYPEDMVTDQPEQFIVRELIREAAIHHTREEVPHAIAVEVEDYAERPDGMLYIRATIHVERESQKRIVIGRGGGVLKAIGTRARREAEVLLGRKVYLDLWVAVTPDWREKQALIRGFYPG